MGQVREIWSSYYEDIGFHARRYEDIVLVTRRFEYVKRAHLDGIRYVDMLALSCFESHFQITEDFKWSI